MALAALASMASCDGNGAADTLPLLPTPAWGRPGALELRRDAGDGLLLRRREGAVYRYDPRTRTLTLADDAAWQASDRPVADCERQVPAAALRIDAASGKVATADGRALATGGTSATVMRQSPGGRYVAVVSAAGRGGSVVPFLGRGQRGPWYHDLFRLPNVERLGGSLRLPFADRTSAVVVCWSADDAYLVFADALLQGAAIVRVGPAGATL
jgi:hypothetical protein